VIREALEASLDSAGQDRAHRRAARLLHADAATAGQVAAHLPRVRPGGDGWVLARLREAAQAAMDSGAPQAAAAFWTGRRPSRRHRSAPSWPAWTPPGMVLVDAQTGAEAEPVLVDRATGRRVDGPDFVFTAGPAASRPFRDRYAAHPKPPRPK
jgi:hypothetical protein